jgi:hypothetical protein
MIKNNKIKIRLIIGALLVLIFMGVAQTHAQSSADIPGKGTGSSNSVDINGKSSGMSYISNPLKVDSVSELVQTAVDIFSYLIVLFGVLALIWTGLQYILARGNPEEMKKQSARLMWIVIGIAIVIGAKIIVNIVINTLSATGAVDKSIISNANQALKQ